MSDVRSVLDVAPLRMLPQFLAAVEALPEVPPAESPMQEALDMLQIGFKDRKKVWRSVRGARFQGQEEGVGTVGGVRVQGREEGVGECGDARV